MKIKSIRKEKTFIPEFNGNRDLAPKDQIVVNIKDFPGIEAIGKIKLFKYDADGNVIINYNNGYLLKNFIGSIKNIDLSEFGYDPVTNGSSLADSKCLELEPIVSEIRIYLLDTAEVLDEKESEASV